MQYLEVYGGISHGRRYRKYDHGETCAQYGVARKTLDGGLEYLSMYKGGHVWSRLCATVGQNPLSGYRMMKGDIVVNFRSKASEVVVGTFTFKPPPVYTSTPRQYGIRQLIPK